MQWKKLLSYVTGSVDQELLLRNEYLVAENRILRSQIQGRLWLSDPERISLAEIGKRLGRKALEEVAQIVRPETILGWHRKLIARKLDVPRNRPPHPEAKPSQEIEQLVVELACQNKRWGYRRLVGALSNLGHEVSHQTVARTKSPRQGRRDFVSGGGGSDRSARRPSALPGETWRIAEVLPPRSRMKHLTLRGVMRML